MRYSLHTGYHDVVIYSSVLHLAGKDEEAAMTRYRFAVNVKSIDHKTHYLKNCQK